MLVIPKIDKRFRLLVASCLVSIALAATAGAQSAEDSPQEPKKETTAAEPQDGDAAQPLKLDGYFAPRTIHRIQLQPNHISELKIESVVSQGATVHAGEVVLRFDRSGYDRRLAEMEREGEALETAVQKARQNLELYRKTATLDLAAAERAQQIAAEELAYFHTSRKTARQSDARFDLKRSENALAYQEEELKQLLKMYEADELTEETEEIILKRTRDGVETLKHNLDRQSRVFDRTMNVEIPREEVQLSEALQRSNLNLQRLRDTHPFELKDKEVALERDVEKQKRQKEELDEFRQDQQWLVVRAPFSGVVYLGDNRRGAWDDPKVLMNQVQPGKRIKPQQVLMTVFAERPLFVAAMIKEADLHRVRSGAACQVRPRALKDKVLEGVVGSLARYPTGKGEFEVEIEVDVPAEDGIVAGMACGIEFPADEDAP